MAPSLSERKRVRQTELQELVETAAPGRHELALSVGVRPSGAPLDLPVTVVKGSVPGPQGAVISGVHGDEAPGPLGTRMFLDELQHETLRGTVVACPMVNLPAFEHRSRVSLWDEVDLVRIWPGESGVTLTHQIASTVTEGVVDGSDFLIDLHSGTPMIHEFWVILANPRCPSPDISQDIEAESRRMAIAFGAGQILRHHPWRTTVSGLAPRGVPTILAEIGGGPDSHRQLGTFLSRMTTGLRNVLKAWEMLEGDIESEFEECVEFDVIEEVKAPDGAGHWVREAASGDHVGPGSVVGAFVDPITGESQEVTVSVEGVVLHPMVTWPQVRAGQWLLAVGQPVETHATPVP